MAVTRKTLTDQVQEQLKNRLLDKEYKVGEYLPSEATLAEEFGVSRTTIRDAVRGLVEKGFLERQHGKGVLVIDNSQDVVADSVRNMMFRENYTAAEFMETRQMIDNEIVRLAATRASDEQIQAMQDCIERMKHNTENVEKYIQMDLKFHTLLAEASQNRLLITLHSAIQPLAKPIVTKVVQQTGEVERDRKYHSYILEAIKKHDPEEAVEKMMLHNAASESMFKESIKDNQTLDQILIEDEN